MNKTAETLALVFPGQGSQAKGMLAEFYENFAIFRQTMEQASDVLKYNVWDLINDKDDSDNINKTHFTQPVLLATSYALWKIWQAHGGCTPSVLAGHSLGEYTALVCAESIHFDDALVLVSERGRLMQSAVSEDRGAMAAIIGLDDLKVEFICKQVSMDGFIVSPANYNSPGQVVVAGEKKAVLNACTIAKESGARMAVLLKVTVPSHCVLMQPIAEEFAGLLADVEINTPKIPVVHNIDISQHKNKKSISEALVRQLYNPVRWSETIEHFNSIGIKKVIECGQGKVLTGLNKRIVKELNNSAISDLVTFNKEVEVCL